jgi:hypothetical protein
MIEADQERTFHTFVRQLGAWWPMETRPITPGKMPEVRVEEWLGGRVYEIRDFGGEYDCGHITSWNPPTSFSFTWAAVPGPEHVAVDLHFQMLGPALTRVVVVHHGWECLSTALLDRYAKFAGGWVMALRRFAAMFEDDSPPLPSVSDDSEPRS